jgi:integrase
MPAISEKIVEALPLPETGNKVHFFSGATLQGKKAPAGFGVRVTAGGTKSFVFFHRANGRKFLETLGRWDENAGGGTLTVRDAIVRADKLAKDIKNGRRDDPRPERTRRLQDGNKVAGLDVAGLLDQFVERYVKKEAKLRSADQIQNIFERLVKPAIGKTGIYDIRRSHIVSMLDDIADNSGPVMADRTLAYFRKAANWWATRDDNFQPPIIKGMARTKPKERERDRILTDDELRVLWRASEAPGPFGPMLRFILLTACRRTEAASMVRSEVAGGVWTIPASRSKNKVESVLPLSMAAQDLLASIPKIKGVDYVFTTGDKPISGFSKFKTKVDKDCGFADWAIHDLRRSARSLMSRAGISADIAERCLGHVMPGVRSVYDRHQYASEKRDAFEALATIIDSILNRPEPSNVRTLRRAR